MKITKAQRIVLLTWIAAGLRTDEINALASNHQPPFKVYPRIVTHYRKTRGVNFREIREADEKIALQQGISNSVILSAQRSATEDLLSSLRQNGLLRPKPRKKAKRSSFVYLFQEEHGATKIGVSSRWRERLKEIDILIPYQTYVVAVIKSDFARQIERELHERYSSRRISGEWFRLSDADIRQILSDYGDGIVTVRNDGA